MALVPESAVRRRYAARPEAALGALPGQIAQLTPTVGSLDRYAAELADGQDRQQEATATPASSLGEFAKRTSRPEFAFDRVANKLKRLGAAYSRLESAV